LVLDSHDLLLTSAEVSVAFMGFASLVAVFVSRGPAGLSERARVVLRSLIDYGLFALLACGLPFVVSALPLPEVNVWALASGAMVAFIIAYMAFSHRYYRDIYVLNSEDGAWLPRFVLFGDVVTFFVLLGNAFGWPYSSSFELYLCAAVFWSLLGAAISFRGLVAMIWSSD
jgi:hypothetical protein